MALIILRCVFVLVFSTLGSLIVIKSDLLPRDIEWISWAALAAFLLLALAVVAADISFRQKRLDTISSVFFGLIVGLFMAYVAGVALTPLFPDPGDVIGRRDKAVIVTTIGLVKLAFGSLFCYVCISLLLQTKHDFRFIIPYVEFSRELKGNKPCILDTSVIIDGRIADVVQTQLFDSQLIMPKFVIGELQGIADSSDRLRRSRGRRGLDILSRLQNSPDVEVEIFDRELPEFSDQPVDMKLVILAKHLEGKLITNDYNLNKVAKLHGVKVINLNDVSNSLKPVFLPGEQFEVQVVKAGEEAGQGIGYLDDGTMVVIESGQDHLHQQVVISVTSVLQTSAGRMIFGRFESAVQGNGTKKTAGEKRSS